MSKMQCGSGQVSTANRHFKKSESYRFKMTVSEDLQTGTGKMGMRRNLLWKTHRYYSISYGPWSEPFWCHIAWQPKAARLRAVDLAVKNFRSYLEGMPTSVIN